MTRTGNKVDSLLWMDDVHLTAMQNMIRSLTAQIIAETGNKDQAKAMWQLMTQP